MYFIKRIAMITAVVSTAAPVLSLGNSPKPRSLTSKTSRYYVNDAKLPDINFSIGESYSGLLPISQIQNETRQLFFWYFPSPNPLAVDEITIWLNGGPGDSSLEGFWQENGPVLWQYGTFRPVPNPWTWVNLTNMVWVEQPVGTGFSQGVPSAKTEEDVARQFLGFFENFVDTFDLHGKRIFIAGESYAGMYVPYIASAMLDANDSTYFNLEATMIYDPLINSNAIMREVTAIPFIDNWNVLLGLNASFVASMRHQADVCGYTNFLNDNLVYPPRGKLPGPPNGIADPNDNCDIFGAILTAATLINPCFNIYQITTTCPLLWDVLGFPGTDQYTPTSASVYFNRTDVQDAIHAPHTDWAEASPLSIYNTSSGVSLEYNAGIFSSMTVLPGVIERSKRTLIGHGGLDYILMRNGTLLSIQNLTWNGMQGFQAPIQDDFYVPYRASFQPSTMAGAGVMGKTRTERGLTFFSVDLSGHMIPQYAPSAAYRSLEVLLGRVESLTSNETFTTSSDGLVAQQPVVFESI